MAFDEGSLTGKFTEQTKFDDGDFRNGYFAGDRLALTVNRVEKRSARPPAARTGRGDGRPLKFALKLAAVSTVIPGMRNARQAEMNCGISDQAPLSDALELKLRQHAWQRGNWYGGK